MKKCTKCGVRKEETEFYPVSRGSSKRVASCKQCRRKYEAASRLITDSRRVAYDANYYQKNKAAINARSVAWQKAHPEEVAVIKDRTRRKNIVRVRAESQTWRDANPDKVAAHNKTYRASRRGDPVFKLKEHTKCVRRRAGKLQATPAWANKNYIEDCYANAAVRMKRDGSVWHVDHIVPLKSKLVCGLHWEENLQVIPGKENQKKSNKHWPDMWGAWPC